MPGPSVYSLTKGENMIGAVEVGGLSPLPGTDAGPYGQIDSKTLINSSILSNTYT